MPLEWNNVVDELIRRHPLPTAEFLMFGGDIHLVISSFEPHQ
jgi:hypothetical protein